MTSARLGLSCAIAKFSFFGDQPKSITGAPLTRNARLRV